MKTELLESLVALARSVPLLRTCQALAIMLFALAVPGLLALEFHRDTKLARLEPERSFAIPVAEVSAFAMWDGVFVLGDRTADLVRLDADDGGVFSATRTWNLANLFQLNIPACENSQNKTCLDVLENLTAQWEGAAFDAAGRLWALQESTQSLHIFAPDLRSVERVLPLDMAEFKVLRRSAFEGVFLLDNGHVLLAQQEKPARLVEFGPAGDKPLGWSGEPAKGTRLPESLKALATWNLPSAVAECSLNELAADRGQLLVLSASCQAVFTIGQVHVNESEVSVGRVLRLPKGLSKPEALATLAPGRYLVGDDGAPEGAPNVHVLIDRNVRAADSENLASRLRFLHGIGAGSMSENRLAVAWSG